MGSTLASLILEDSVFGGNQESLHRLAQFRLIAINIFVEFHLLFHYFEIRWLDLSKRFLALVTEVHYAHHVDDGWLTVHFPIFYLFKSK